MFHAIFRQVRRFFRKKQEPKPIDSAPDSPIGEHCAKITMYVREDGEFSLSTEFEKIGEDESDVTSMVFHMLNSGLLVEYFIQALNLWATTDEQKKFILSIIEKWKLLYDSDEDIVKTTQTTKLAVDPSDVFGLKRLKET